MQGTPANICNTPSLPPSSQTQPLFFALAGAGTPMEPDKTPISLYRSHIPQIRYHCTSLGGGGDHAQSEYDISGIGLTTARIIFFTLITPKEQPSLFFMRANFYCTVNNNNNTTMGKKVL